MVGVNPGNDAEQANGQAELAARLEYAKAEARSVIGPAMESIGKIETIMIVDLTANVEIRSDTELPPGVVLYSGSEKAQLDQAKRILTDHDVEFLYTEMGRHGTGRVEDITLREAGLPADALQELGGAILPTKMTALKEMTLEQRPELPEGGEGEVGPTQPIMPGDIVQTAAKHRKLQDAKGEFAVAARLVAENQQTVARHMALFRELGVDPENPQNEWDAAAILWLSDPEFVAADSPREVGTVEVDGGPNGQIVSGRLLEVGSIRGRKLYLQEVPRTLAFDKAGKPIMRPGTDKQRYIQPNASEFAAAHAGILGVESVAVAESSTYLAETIAEITKTKFERALAGKPSVRIAPIAYGTARLARIQGDPAPQRPKLGHALGGIQKAARTYRELDSMITDYDIEQLSAA